MNKENSLLPYWLAASYLPNIGPRKFLEILMQFDNIKNLFFATADELAARGLSKKQIENIKCVNWKIIEADLKWADVTDHHLIAYDNQDYPLYLKEIANPPLILFVLGDKKILCSRQLAIVGARNATPQGLENAYQFAFSLVQAGFTITSGLALGVDGAAHQGALAANGLTIGVSGAGLHHVYPRAHHQLYQKIVEQGGALVSEFSLDMPPIAKNFPRRNRIIGGLSLGVLVVEAALRSGSLSTARQALEQGKEIFALPGSIHNPLARGCHYLIREGAKLVEGVNDIIEEFGVAKLVTISPQAFVYDDNLSKEAKYLLKQIEYEITPIDVIISRTGLTASEVSSILLTLEIRGFVHSVTGGYLRAIQK